MKIQVELTRLLSVFSFACCGLATEADGESVPMPAVQSIASSAGNSSLPITFSEFPLDTRITTQYISRGVVFGPDAATITNDGSTTSSPVLSGRPKYSGPISGHFVKPSTGENTTVLSFSFSAGYFDEVASARVEWLDPAGVVIGQVINQRNGIETLVAKGGNIAGFRVGVLQDEPNGFVIDNFAINPGASGILFRELADGAKDGSWGLGGTRIPGFDHVALNYLGSVYEAHPGYRLGPVYVSKDAKESIVVEAMAGVQSVHKRSTFEHDSREAATAVVDFQEIPIESSEALAMMIFMRAKIRTAAFISFDTNVDRQLSVLHPDIQKGRNNSFTGCGLVEWAAERANINGGEGFVSDKLESIMLQNETFPLLSPQLLYFAMRNQNLLRSFIQAVKGFVSLADYVVTDPLGRRVGYVNGTRFTETPSTFSTPNGDLEYLIILNPIPGNYALVVYGVGDAKGLAVLTVESGQSCVVRVKGHGRPGVCNFRLSSIVGSKGDVNRDASIDHEDVALLRETVPLFTNEFSNSADINGDGILDVIDVNLLTSYVNRSLFAPSISPRNPPSVAPLKAPARAPATGPLRLPSKPPMSPVFPTSDLTPTNVRLSNAPANAPTPLSTKVPLSIPSKVPPAWKGPTKTPLSRPITLQPASMRSKSPIRMPPYTLPPAPLTQTRIPFSAAPAYVPRVLSTKLPLSVPSKIPPVWQVPTKTPLSNPSIILQPAPMQGNSPIRIPPYTQSKPAFLPPKSPLGVPSNPPSIMTVSPVSSSDPTSSSGCPLSDACNAGFFFKFYPMHKTVSALGRKKCAQACVFRSAIRLKKLLGWDCGRCE
jgi:hypothetical protein